MSLFPRSFSVSTAVRDLGGYFAQKHEHRGRFLLIAIAVAAVFFTLIAIQFTGRKGYKEAEVTYVQQWPSTRTVEEVRAQQIKDAPAERAERARQAAEEAKRKEQFRKAGEALKKLGM